MRDYSSFFIHEENQPFRFVSYNLYTYAFVYTWSMRASITFSMELFFFKNWWKIINSLSTKGLDFLIELKNAGMLLEDFFFKSHSSKEKKKIGMYNFKKNDVI